MFYEPEWEKLSLFILNGSADNLECVVRIEQAIIFHFFLSLSLMEGPWLAIFCLLKLIIHSATVMDGDEST